MNGPPQTYNRVAGVAFEDMSPQEGGVTGQFFANRKPNTANKVAYDTGMTARLWQVSADLVGHSLVDLHLP